MVEEASHVSEQHPERHEHSDVNIAALAKFGVWFLAIAVLVQVLIYGICTVLENREKDRDEKQQRSAVMTSNDLPADVPKLQGMARYYTDVPRVDRIKMQDEQEKILSTSGKTDDPSFGRIPIEKAMELLVQQNRAATQRTGDAAK